MAKQVDPVPLLTPRQAAKLLNLPTHAIREMIHRKELPAFKLGKRWRIRITEVTKLLPPSS